MNSDTYIVEECLTKSLEYIKEHKDIGALGCKVNSLMEPRSCVQRGFPTPKASLYYFLNCKNKSLRLDFMMHYIYKDEVGEVDSLMGAFMLMPRSVLNKVGLLDEDFCMEKI